MFDFYFSLYTIYLISHSKINFIINVRSFRHRKVCVCVCVRILRKREQSKRSTVYYQFIFQTAKSTQKNDTHFNGMWALMSQINWNHCCSNENKVREKERKEWIDIDWNIHIYSIKCISSRFSVRLWCRTISLSLSPSFG